MSVARVKELPYPEKKFESHEDAWEYCKELRNSLQEEQSERIEDFDVLKIDNMGWEDVRAYAKNATKQDGLANAISKISTTETTLLISNQQDVTADATIPSTMTLRFMQGGSLNISSTKTVTINGQVEAGLFQIFEGDGTVVFGHAHEVYPDWFRENTTPGTTDMTTALTKAYDSCAVSETVGAHATMVLSGKTYRITSGLTWNNWTNVRGTQMETSILLKDGDFAGVTIATVGTNRFTEFYVKGNTGNGDVGILITNGSRIEMSRVMCSFHASHNIHLWNGTQGRFRNIITTHSVGGDGFRVEDNYGFGGGGDRACWANSFDNIDTRSNAGWGFNIVSGSANVGKNIVSQQNDGGVNIDKGITNNLEVYIESNDTYGLVLTSNTTRNDITINQDDVIAYSDAGTDNRIGGPGMSIDTFQSIGRPIQGTNVAGRDFGVYGGHAGAGATGRAGGKLQHYGGNAAGTTGDASGGGVWLQGGTPVNSGGYGAVVIQPSGGGVVVGSQNQGNTSTLIQLDSTTRTLRFPNMTTAQKNALTATAGMVVWDATLGKLQVCTVAGSPGAWASLH